MTAHISTPQASDPWEMALIHSLIRRGFEEAREAVLTPGAPARADAVARYVGFHLDGLQAHHSTEDEFIWPALYERASMSRALIRRMEEQHSGLHDALDATHRELTAWEASPTAERSAALAEALGTVADLRGESPQRSSDRKRGTSTTRSRTAAQVTWTYAAMFGVPAVPVAIFLAEKGRLPSLWGLFDMYGRPWSSRFADDRVVALLPVYSGLVLAAVLSGWLLWQMRKAGAVLNLALLPVEAVFWSGFALPVPWLFGIARVALVALAWPELSRSRRQESAVEVSRAPHSS